MAIGRPLKLRLFLEGVECPVISATVISSPNAPMQCSLQVPPASFGTKLFPRTVVHVFFLDYYETENPNNTYRGQGPQATKPQNPTVYEQSKKKNADDAELSDTNIDLDFEADKANVRYKLLFCGEIAGFTWSKTPNARSLVLQCMDMSNYWDYAYQFSGGDLFGPGAKALFSGGSTNLLTDFLSSPGEIVAGLLHQKSAQYPGIEGLLGGLVRLLESIGGSYYYDNKFQGQNVFFSLAELRLHITQMITAYPGDDTAKKLLWSDGYGGMFGRALGGLGEQVSIRDALNALMKVIFHETCAIPTPLYVPGTAGTVGGQVRKRIQNIPAYYFAYSTAVTGQVSLSEVSESITLADQISAGTRAVLAGDPAKNKLAIINRLTRLRSQCLGNAQACRLKQLPSAVPYFSAASVAIASAITKIKASWVVGAPASPKRREIVDKLNEAKAQLKNIEELDVNTTAKKDQIPARLNSHIFKPDIWFGAPVRCNVLFPDQYISLEYARNWLKEPTRLLLKTSNEFYGEDELFDNFFFAPQARTAKGKKSTLQGLFNRDIFDHELFTGILPVFEKMGEANIFAVRSGTVQGKTPKISLAQRSTNFLYFKHRFAARAMQVSCLFNPYVAPGFPGLIVDKYVSASKAEEFRQVLMSNGKTAPALSELLGTHFLGSFAQVTHTLDQSQRQGRTDIGIAFPREYGESTEFFGAASTDDQEVQKRFGTDAVRVTDVAALGIPPIGSIGPNFGQITAVSEVSSKYTPISDTNFFSLPLYAGPRRSGTGQLSTSVPVGVAVKAGTLGPAVLELVGDANRLVKFKAYAITESVPRYRVEKVFMAAEDLIRPGWYSAVWENQTIGQIYQHYLRTGAITDKTQIADAGDLPIGDRTNEATDALRAVMSGLSASTDIGTQAPALLTLDMDATIEQAVQFIVLTYSYAKQSGINIDEYIKAYTWRPIATMVDMFGTSDLQYTPNGEQVTLGIEGFHSKAFGNYENLFGLVTQEITEILNVKRDDPAKQKMDVRKRRRDAVLRFLDSIQYSLVNGA